MHVARNFSNNIQLRYTYLFFLIQKCLIYINLGFNVVWCEWNASFFTESKFRNIPFEVPIIISIFHNSMMLRRE